MCVKRAVCDSSMSVSCPVSWLQAYYSILSDSSACVSRVNGLGINHLVNGKSRNRDPCFFSCLLFVATFSDKISPNTGNTVSEEELRRVFSIGFWLVFIFSTYGHGPYSASFQDYRTHTHSDSHDQVQPLIPIYLRVHTKRNLQSSFKMELGDCFW